MSLAVVKAGVVESLRAGSARSSQLRRGGLGSQVLLARYDRRWLGGISEPCFGRAWLVRLVTENAFA